MVSTFSHFLAMLRTRSYYLQKINMQNQQESQSVTLAPPTKKSGHIHTERLWVLWINLHQNRLIPQFTNCTVVPFSTVPFSADSGDLCMDGGDLCEADDGKLAIQPVHKRHGFHPALAKLPMQPRRCFSFLCPC